MKRREFIALVGGAAAAWPMAALAQRHERPPTIGFLSPASASGIHYTTFQQGMRELGYVVGKNIAIEARFAEGKFDRLPELATELVSLKVELIVAAVTQASLAAKSASKTIPIVMQGVSDPVGTGLVASLARPGANVTGTSAMSAEVVGKSLELLRGVLPSVPRVAVLWNPDNAIFQAQMLRETQIVAGTLGLELQPFGARTSNEIDQAFVAMTRARVGALLVFADPVFSFNRTRIAELAAKDHLPAVYGSRDYVVAGGLMSYGPDYDDVNKRAAIYVDKILKGAAPADLPVEQSIKFSLILNLRTAKALGLTVPPTLLARADEVIE